MRRPPSEVLLAKNETPLFFFFSRPHVYKYRKRCARGPSAGAELAEAQGISIILYIRDPEPESPRPFFMFPREYFIIQIFVQRPSLQYCIANYSRVCNFRSKRRTNKNDARVRQFFYFFFLRVQATPRTKKGQASMCPPPTCPPGRRVFTCVAGLVQLKQRCRVFD